MTLPNAPRTCAGTGSWRHCVFRRWPDSAAAYSTTTPTRSLPPSACRPTTTSSSTSGVPAPDMYVPMIIGQLWDPVGMAAEIRRCAERGARALTFPEGTVSLGLPSLFSDYWDPIFRACEETEVVVCMHIGSSGELFNPAPDGHFIIPIALGNLNAQAAMVTFAMSPVPRKFPNIKLAIS